MDQEFRPMDKTWTTIASSLAAIAVMIGAFGAHALQKTLESTGKAAAFETGSKYHFYHALALLLIGFTYDKGNAVYLLIYY